MAKPLISVDGQFTDWIASERIDYGDVSGYNLYAQAQGESYYFMLAVPVAIGANTTFWFNTDQNTATGYQIFGFAGGAEYNVNIKSDGTAALYSGGAGQTLVLDNIPIAYSADHKAIEFAIPKTAIGTPGVIGTLYDVNDTVFAPSNYSAQPYVAYNNDIVRTDPAHKVAIVYSGTTAARYFSQTAYSQLFMAVQSQAMQAGISFDLLDEGDLTNVAKLANYDTIVFPSFANVQAGQVTAIADALLRVTKQFGVGLVTAGNFMTNDETGAALAGDSYARMKLLFDATRVTGGFPADVTVTSSDASQAVLKTMSTGTVIHNYKSVPWDAFQSVSGTGQTVATQTVNGTTYAAALATQTGGKNVLFSTAGVMADNNLLWQAIDYTANNPGISVDLEISRNKGIVASRTDMDQAMYTDDVSPETGPGIYDKLLPILTDWKAQYNFVGSYYVDIGNNPAQNEVTNWAVSAPYYAQILALGNELGSHSLTHPENTNLLTPAQIQTEFQQSKQIIEQRMSAYLGRPFTVEGAAVPGATETLPTSKEIIKYYDYITGGFSGIGSGYPGAFGYLDSNLTSSVYLAPNTSFDFTLADYQKLGAAGASAAWATEWNQLTANADLPIVLWPWHDYGPTLWQTDAPNASPYSLQMFTDWIQRAYQSGMEFVTQADLAGRIKSFDASAVTSSITGSTVNVTVNSSHASNFALDINGAGGQVIQNAGSWYAFDDDQLFLPETGGSYTITLGTSQDDVTHIASLPMRGDLLSVSGDGRDIDFSMVGEGDVIIALGAVGSLSPVVTGSGAAIASQNGDQLVVRLTGLGRHDVSVRMQQPAAAPPTETVSTVAFSADTGASATDLVTNTAAQTVTGTLSAPLATGDVVQVSLDNGTAWRSASAAVGGTTFSLSNVTLTGSNTLIARVANSDGVTNTPLSRGYVLDTAAPAETVAITAMTLDTGVAGDFITSDGAAGRTVSGTLSTALAAGEALRVSTDGSATWLTPTVSGTSWSVTDTASHAASWTISAQVTDLAGNLGPLATRAVTLDTAAPTASSVPDLATASDSGVSGTDNLTNVTAPTFTGTAQAGATVTLYDGATAIGMAQASSAGAWSIVSAALADGAHAISAQAKDAAGNVGAASAALAVTIDTVAPAAPSPPDLATASDSGSSSTDNITNVTTPVFTGTAEEGSTVRLLDGTIAIGTATASSTGAWSVTTTLANGAHSITAAATDPAGNAGPASTALAVTIDQTAPAAPVLSGGTAQSNFFTLNGRGEAGNTVTILDGTTGAGTATVGDGGSWSWQFLAGPTARTFTAVQTDRAGNVGAASALMVTGTDGANALSGGTKNDLFVGGSGTDTFSFAGAFGDDIIADFAASGATHDVISFQASSKLNSFAAVMKSATQVGTNVVIKDTSNTVTLLNVSKSSLTAPDFTFV